MAISHTTVLFRVIDLLTNILDGPEYSVGDVNLPGNILDGPEYSVGDVNLPGNIWDGPQYSTGGRGLLHGMLWATRSFQGRPGPPATALLVQRGSRPEP